MDNNSLFPSNIVVLGEALRPLWLKLKEEMDRPASQTKHVSSMIDFVSRHLHKIADNVERLADSVNNKLDGVIMDRDVSDAGVYRAAGSLEACLDDLSAGYSEVRSLRVFDRNVEASALLAATYRHTLTEIETWLGDICETIRDPIASLKKRGLPTTGEVELEFLLHPAVSPQARELMLWMEREVLIMERHIEMENPDFGELIVRGYEKARAARTGQTVKKENLDFGLLIARGYEKAGPARARKERIKQEHERARLAKVREERIKQEHEKAMAIKARKESARYQRELEQVREEVALLTIVAGIALGAGIFGLIIGADSALDI